MSDERFLRELVDFGHGLLDETDAIALRHFDAGVAPTRKPDRTFVTRADTEVEQRLRERIAGRYPDHGIAGEEYGSDGAGAEIGWIVDPIDATHNFMRGIPIFATLVAVRLADRLAVGLVSAPALGERWWAAAGMGAHRRRGATEQPIRVSSVARLADAQLVFGSAAALDGRVPDLARASWRDRGFGDFWGHMLVAGGSAEAMLEDGVSEWDVAAPHVIVREAGGRMTDLDGRDTSTAQRIVTSNGAVHDELLERIARMGRDLAVPTSTPYERNS